MFKINMNLEMEGDTDALAAKVEAAPPRELERQPYDDFDIAVIRALQGPMEVVDRPYDAAAAEVGLATEDVPRPSRGDDRAQAAAPRRRDPLPSPRRILGQRHGGLAGARGADPRRRRPDGRRPRHLPLLPAPDLRRLALQRLHDGPRPLQGGVRRGPRRRSPTSTTCTAPTAPSLYSSTEFKKIRLHYFTDDYAGWEAEHASRLPVGGSGARTLAEPARGPPLMPGGVNSPVRAMGSIGRDPIFIERGEGAESGTSTATATSTGSAPGAR